MTAAVSPAAEAAPSPAPRPAGRYMLVYGAISGAIVVSILIAGIFFDVSHIQNELFGYLVMLVALSLIFIGVKRYRDVECGGVIRFLRGFGIGLGIAAVASVIYMLGWEAYEASTGYRFMDSYIAGMLDRMRESGATPAAIQAKAAELEEMAVSYRNPLIRMPMVFAEIFPVGFLVALLSALLLRNPRLLPAPRRAEPEDSALT